MKELKSWFLFNHQGFETSMFLQECDDQFLYSYIRTLLQWGETARLVHVAIQRSSSCTFSMLARQFYSTEGFFGDSWRMVVFSLILVWATTLCEYRCAAQLRVLICYNICLPLCSEMVSFTPAYITQEQFFLYLLLEINFVAGQPSYIFWIFSEMHVYIYVYKSAYIICIVPASRADKNAQKHCSLHRPSPAPSLCYSCVLAVCSCSFKVPGVKDWK